MRICSGLSSAYRLYACADDSWVFLALVTDTDRARFLAVLEDSGFTGPTEEDLALGNATAGRVLEALFAKQSADAWQQACIAAGVGCLRADGPLPSTFWLEDPQAQSLGLTAPVSHPDWGEYRRHGPLVHFDAHTPELQPPPLVGQHSDQVLAGLGYGPEEIKQLKASGAVI